MDNIIGYHVLVFSIKSSSANVLKGLFKNAFDGSYAVKDMPWIWFI